jgi:murein DD-endopeptidase MepM/ murein hydrolase activator NlpD
MSAWKLPFPDKYVTGEFGTRSKFRIANNLGPHRGVDWARPAGTKIPAVTSGTVSLVQYSKVLGWVLVHTGWAEGKTWHIGYSHLLEEPTLKVGDKVKVGQTIGLMGSTGSASSGPHLHATLGSTAKSVFWGKVVDLKAFIKRQMVAEEETKKPAVKKGTAGTAKGAVKPLSTKTAAIKTVSSKPAAKKPAAAKPAAKPATVIDRSTKRMYTVKSGDSYWKIGKQFKVDYRKLQRINNNKPLRPGDVIKLD